MNFKALQGKHGPHFRYPAYQCVPCKKSIKLHS
ncbi:hypothetical protein T12_4760 [Trichinella patagoniensis]|uniref:Uncharacterized protein n=1 Tax=Trichinella patagoniensis TaxID=990121 RepID=A0A0V0YZE1_9BILA|nr:hypothetical protein T12_4760 [Trichinella patagoniensis]